MLYLLTRTDAWCEAASALARARGANVLTGEWGEPSPLLNVEPGSVLLSFLSPWIVPVRILDACSNAINFHPGDRNYPGIGCYNFALYDGAARYGAVAHLMAPTVDTGPILLERTFEVAPDETVQSLRTRTLDLMLGMFSYVLDALPDLGTERVAWTRKPYRRADLEALCELTADMTPVEVARRVRATTYPGKPGASYRSPIEHGPQAA